MDIDNIFYINLDHRTDRKKHIENELKKMSWLKYMRFNAIKNKNGRFGCAQSHLALLEYAKETNLEYIIILEDDIHFKNPKMFNELLIKFFKLNMPFDVLLFVANTTNNIKINNFVSQTKHSYSTAGYLVRNHYYDKLINNIKNNMYNKGYAIDVYYTHLQKKDRWFFLRPRTVSQLPGYSDIERKQVNYDKCLLDKI
jgi:GR25 family glycosyltransferase involved in LPS biosynthesis